MHFASLRSASVLGQRREAVFRPRQSSSSLVDAHCHLTGRAWQGSNGSSCCLISSLHRPAAAPLCPRSAFSVRHRRELQRGGLRLRPKRPQRGWLQRRDDGQEGRGGKREEGAGDRGGTRAHTHTGGQSTHGHTRNDKHKQKEKKCRKPFFFEIIHCG